MENILLYQRNLTFLDLDGEDIHLLHPLLQLIFCRRCNWIHVVVAPIVFLIGEGAEDLGLSKAQS